jgi:hypothetical protein
VLLGVRKSFKCLNASTNTNRRTSIVSSRLDVIIKVVEADEVVGPDAQRARA